MEADAIVKLMLEKDYFSQWLGIELLKLEPGSCELQMKIRKDMLNGFGIAHGGITYSLADSALAFASNSKGPKSLSIETSIAHIVSLAEGDTITAVANCETETNKIGHYNVKIFKSAERQNPVAIFNGIVYKTSKNW
jgi:acyl-CoA thioesterase